MQSEKLLQEKMQLLHALRGNKLCALVEYIYRLKPNNLVNIPRDYAPWLYEYAIFIHATGIAETLMNYIGDFYYQTALEQKVDFDNAMKLYMAKPWQFRNLEGNLVDLLVRMHEHDASTLKRFFGNKYGNSSYLLESSIYLEFVLRTNQKVDEYISYVHSPTMNAFNNYEINIEDYITFLRNYHTLIIYQNKNYIINVYDYINYLGTKSFNACIELLAQINESGQLESGDIVISKASIIELVNSKEFQMLKEGKLKPHFA